MKPEELTKAQRYRLPGGDQFIEVFKNQLATPEQFRGAMLWNIFKYPIRYRQKGGIIDLQKASCYLDELIKFELENACDYNVGE
jgi:hypothetical protein